jgi:two-component sensor histidine kinase
LRPRRRTHHFGDLAGDRVIVRAPDLRINAAAAQAIGMALHGLATNAAKYGALSAEKGCVEIVAAFSGLGQLTGTTPLLAQLPDW